MRVHNGVPSKFQPIFAYCLYRFPLCEASSGRKNSEIYPRYYLQSTWHVLNMSQLPSLKNARIPTSIYLLDLAVEKYLWWQNMVLPRKKEKKIKWLDCISLKLCLPWLLFIPSIAHPLRCHIINEITVIAVIDEYYNEK